MVKVTAICKYTKNRVISYKLVDSDGKSVIKTSKEIKEAINSKRLDVANLKVTSDNRLIISVPKGNRSENKDRAIKLDSNSLYGKMINTWKEYSDFKMIECNLKHTEFSFNDYLLEIENVSKDSGLNINIGYGYYAHNTLCMVRNDREIEPANALILDIVELLTGKKKYDISNAARVAYYKSLARADFEPYEDSEGRLTNQIIDSMDTELIKLLDSGGIELPDYMMLIQKRIDEFLVKHTYNYYSQYVVNEISSRRKKNITDRKLIHDLTDNYLWLIASFGFGEKSLNNNFMRSTLINLQEYNSRNISYYRIKRR